MLYNGSISSFIGPLLSSSLVLLSSFILNLFVWDYCAILIRKSFYSYAFIRPKIQARFRASDIALELDVDNASRLRKQELMFAILKKRAKAGEQIFGDGTLEILPDGFGFLRSPVSSYLASTEDIYISPSQIRRFNLHTGDTVEGEVRIPKGRRALFCFGQSRQSQRSSSRSS